MRGLAGARCSATEYRISVAVIALFVEVAILNEVSSYFFSFQFRNGLPKPHLETKSFVFS